MKKFIYKTNQYLLERFPTIWNTRLVWMLLIAIVFHILFYAIGFVTLTNPESLHEPYIEAIFFKNGSAFLNGMISVLLLVGWLIYMFKNNAFKNFYPASSSKLFGQFMCHMIIIFSCSTFFLSYNFGLKSYIAITYPDEQINKEIEIANDAAMFFSDSVEDYTIDNRKYPQLFFDLYCEMTEEFIDINLPYEDFLGETYQFYTLKEKQVQTTDRDSYISVNDEYYRDSTLTKYVYSKNIDNDMSVLYFKDSVVNIRPHIQTIKPSYYNAVSTFFISKNDTLFNDNYYSDYGRRNRDYNEYNYGSYNYRENALRQQFRNKRNTELLNRNDKNEINGLLEDFLKFSNYYKIPHNITAQEWTELVYHPDNFEVQHFIRTQPKSDFSFNEEIIAERTRFEQYYVNRVTDFYYSHSYLDNVFDNIEDVKALQPFSESVHFIIWFTFIFACFIFMFRITGLKPLLFSVITVGVLALIIALFGALLFFILNSNDDLVGYIILYIVLIIATFILLVPIVFIDRMHKLIVGICVNISIVGFPLYLLLITGIITMHQDNACSDRADYYESGYYCYTMFDWLGIYWSFAYFVLTILFLIFYTKVIKKWKALPEG